jgi:hypothetical protein
MISGFDSSHSRHSQSTHAPIGTSTHGYEDKQGYESNHWAFLWRHRQRARLSLCAFNFG